MPSVNVYLSFEEMYELTTAAKDKGKKVGQLAREILHEWLLVKRGARGV